MADKYASWGAEHGALDPAIIAQQQIRNHIMVAVQNRLLGISMAVTVEDLNKVAQRPKARRKRPWAARSANYIRDGGVRHAEAAGQAHEPG
eukprot:5848676-Pyramimonas_sp.AAC.1